MPGRVPYVDMVTCLDIPCSPTRASHDPLESHRAFDVAIRYAIQRHGRSTDGEDTEPRIITLTTASGA